MLVADRYQLSHPLGRGAIGEVWHATDHVLNRPVAVKLLKSGQSDQSATTDAERFRMEARTAGRLNHPNLVGVYDFGSQGGQLYLVMELVDGWSLAQERSMRGALPPREAADIAAQMAVGLAAAHRQGVIHRDIKPANVMLTADRTVKITDFGIARFADDSASTLTATGKIVGSAAYLAPERGLGRPAQPASDVYSLGCVLYELLTGRPPFPGSGAVAVVRQHIESVPVPPHRLRPEIPVPLSEYVIRLLAKDPAERPTAEQVAAWLTGADHRMEPTAPLPPAAATAVLPAPAPAPPPASRPAAARRGRRRASPRALLSVAGLALFAAAAGVGATLSSGDGDDPGAPAPTAPVPMNEAPSVTPSLFVPEHTSEERTGEEEHKDAEGDGKKDDEHKREKRDGKDEEEKERD
ncbi:serine/threonine-protein kinase [Streptomyces sp. enrichment culture]|uniref:serine/threonine-protein kinase n=1 Tax=Streptomyces sp. enrichment culture TaxID=1795815 RepID=UPI003F545BEA